MKKVLSIIGPTATGKTAYALRLAESFHRDVDLISADSRQVYQGMEIGTGVDLPSDFTVQTAPQFEKPFLTNGSVRIHGISIVKPTDEWSVAHFREFARGIIDATEFPILVGGTGLYHRHVFSDDPQLSIKPDARIRDKAAHLSVEELQHWLEEKNPQRLAELNSSDRANPRRLVRALEKNDELTLPPTSTSYDRLTIGLTDSLEHIEEKIRQRIVERLQIGAIQEVQELMVNYDAKEWKLPAFSATGFKELRALIEDTLSQTAMETLWLRRELQYAKRQLTWWKKEKNIKWFNVSEPDWQKAADDLIRQWSR